MWLSVFLVLLQHYIDLNTQYLLVLDGSSNGYLRMQGSGSEYIPMVSPVCRVPCDDVINYIDDTGDSYQFQVKKPREPSELSLEWTPSTMVHNTNELDRDEKLNSQCDLCVKIGGDGTVETTALVHPRPKDSPSDSDQSQEEEAHSAEPFLSRSDSDRSENDIPLRRHRKGGYKCNDSMTSDTSSGFHSDYIPDDSAPPEYSLVVMNPGNGEVMI